MIDTIKSIGWTGICCFVVLFSMGGLITIDILSRQPVDAVENLVISQHPQSGTIYSFDHDGKRWTSYRGQLYLHEECECER